MEEQWSGFIDEYLVGNQSDAEKDNLENEINFVPMEGNLRGAVFSKDGILLKYRASSPRKKDYVWQKFINMTIGSKSIIMNFNSKVQYVNSEHILQLGNQDDMEEFIKGVLKFAPFDNIKAKIKYSCR